MKIRMFAVAALAAALIAAPMAAVADDAPPAEAVLVEEAVVAVEAPAVPETPADVAPEADPVSSEPVSVPETPAPVAIEAAPVVELASKGDHGQPDMICAEAGFETKVDTVGDPATVEVFAPEGFLIDAYCVKAGTTKHIITVDPPAASVVIDHPEKDSVSHYQVRLVEIPDVEITPRACVGVGALFTEGDDLPPVQTAEGLLFQGGSGKAVGIGAPVTGNLQGWQPVSFVNDGGQSQFFFRIVIDASADGGKAYQSLSFPGYTTIDSASVSYQFGESIAATAERFPNAVLRFVFFQTNSGAPADYSAVLKSVTGPCLTVDFEQDPEVPEKPADIVTVDEVETTDCETDIITTTTTTTTTGTVLVENVWVATEPVVVVTSSERAASDVECPPVVPPVDEEPTPGEPAKAGPVAQADGLAATGSNLPLFAGGFAIALLLAGAVAVTAGLRRR
jgi:hypothetical protein